MSLFQRIKTPFGDMRDDDYVESTSSAQAVGVLLRERREELGYDLDAIGEALRIKPLYLAALEQGRAQDLPGPTYAIGFIRAYAQLLNLDADRILDSYKAECSEVHARPDLSLPVALDARSLPGGPILLVGVILAACGYGTWYYLATGERSRPERVAAVPAELQRAVQGTTAPALAGISALPANPTTGPAANPAPGAAAAAAPRFGSGLLSPQGVTPAPTALAASPPSADLVANPPSAPKLTASTPPTADPPAAASPKLAAAVTSAGETPAARPEVAPAAPSSDTAKLPVHIDIRALADCWIQVKSSDDQSIVFSRILKSGETYHVPRTGLVLRTGNAGALALVVDGKPAPAIGGVGTLRREVSLDPQALLAGTAVRG